MTPDYSRRTIFDRIAVDYDQVRPGYPAQLVEDVIALSAVPKTGRILEIGCATGQATIPFARQGFSITCLEIGRNLASLAIRNCREYPQVRVLPVSFEDWQPAREKFDLVMSASAFHWVPPEIGYPKAARVLREAGCIALFSNLHPTPYMGFFQEVQAIYQKFVPEWTKQIYESLTFEQVIRLTGDQLNETGLFSQVSLRKYAWEKQFRRDEYLRLLNTFSDHRALDDDRRGRLFEAIGDLIDKHYGGVVTRPYLTVLHIAKKLEIGRSNKRYSRPRLGPPRGARGG